VNTFLVLSGLLTALLTLNELRALSLAHTITPAAGAWGVFGVNFVVKRWVRIVPGLATTMLFGWYVPDLTLALTLSLTLSLTLP